MITIWCSGITQGGQKCKVTAQRARNVVWFCQMHKGQAGLLHMTQTYPTLEGDWTVHCRCGWRDTGSSTQRAARKIGDLHLEEENVTPEGTGGMTTEDALDRRDGL